VEQRLVTGPTLAGDHAYNTKSKQLAQSYGLDSSYVGFRVSIITDRFELIHNGISDASMILMRKEKFSTLCCGVLCTRKAWMCAHDANAANSFFPFFCVFCMHQTLSSHSSVYSVSMLHWARLDWMSSHTPHAEEFFHVGMWNWGVLQYTATATTTDSGSNSFETTTYLAS
jgi:hypothetical protein